MWVVINKKDWTFLPYKHASSFAVANLCWIEISHKIPIHMMPLDYSFPSFLTVLQMQALYKNTTGQPCQHYGEALRNVLLELAERITPTDVNLFELDKQAEQVIEGSLGEFQYARGQFKPRLRNGVQAPDRITLPRATNENEIASRPRARPATVTAPPSATGVAPTSSARPARPPSGPRQGGVRDLVWAVADKLWEDAGKPSDVKVVLELRKSWMGILETEHGVKRTSSSNELGNWMKARIQK